MSCEYTNLEQLCLNQYTYTYAASSGDNDPVYRIDKDTGSKTLITFSNNLETVLPCDPNSEEDIMTAWECYQIWRDAGNIPLTANISQLKNQKKTEILSEYNNILAKKYTSVVDSTNVEVDLSLESALDFVSSISNVKVEEPVRREVIYTGTATATYSAGPEYNYTPGGLVPTSIQTIRVPDIITLPAVVTFDAGCDDGLAINGTRVSSFAQIPPPFVITERTFEAGTWNDGGPWACGGTFTFQTQATGSNNFVAGIEQTTARPINTNITTTTLLNNQWNNIVTNYSAYVNKLESTKNQLLQQIDSATSVEALENLVWDTASIEPINPIIDLNQNNNLNENNCDPSTLSYYPLQFADLLSGCSQNYADGIVWTPPAIDSANRTLPARRTVMIIPSAARFPNGQYFSRYIFRTSLTGDTEYFVNGFQNGNNFHVAGPAVYGVCTTGSITIEILMYQTAQLLGFTSNNEPIFENICSGSGCWQCNGVPLGSVYGWGFDFYYDQSDGCGCAGL